ncbi:MAG: DNA repair exonuclease [Hyphomicrobiaceae bacterium]
MLRFIHTSDWHIGKSFGGFPPDRQGVLRDARLSAIDRIAEAARQDGASHVLVAGDVYDNETLPARETAHLIERLKAHADLFWILLPGNHDADRPGGIYERLTRSGTPGNLMICREARPMALGQGAVLLPAPLQSRTRASDPTAWMDSAATAPDDVRIGLAHGSVQGFGTESEASALIAEDRARSAGLAYLALGDWHGTNEINPATWYSGAPEPDRYLGNRSGQVLAVTIKGPSALPEVRAIATKRFHWLGATLEAHKTEDVERFVTRVAETAGGLDRLLLRLRLSGAAPILEHGKCLATLARLAERLFHLDLDRDAFAVLPDRDDLAELGSGNDLEAVARQLVAIRGDEGRPAAPAGRALEILFRLVAQAGP